MKEIVKHILLTLVTISNCVCYGQQPTDSSKVLPVIYYGGSSGGNFSPVNSRLLQVKYPPKVKLSSDFEIIDWSMTMNDTMFNGNDYRIPEEVDRYLKGQKKTDTLRISVTAKYQDSLTITLSDFFIVKASNKSYDLHYKLLDSGCGIDITNMTRNSDSIVVIDKNQPCKYFKFSGYVHGTMITIKDLNDNLLYQESFEGSSLDDISDENYFNYANHSILKLEIFGDYGWEGLIRIE